MLFIWLSLVFALGAVVGSFLNVCIYRIPLEKSVFWPGSRCGHCYQPIRGYDNIPLISYWLLRGRCRTCKTSFSARYFGIELLTALSFVGLFYLEVVVNVNGLMYEPWQPPPAPVRKIIILDRDGKERNPLLDQRLQQRASHLELQRINIARGYPPPGLAWAVFIFHAVLLSFLIVATFCDFDRREIPLAITGPGTALGLIGAVLFPWPWPGTEESATLGLEAGQPWSLPYLDANHQPLGPKAGLYPWPVWGPLPDWLPPGSWQLGLATGIAGILAGTFMLRIIGFLFTKGLGREAMGLGDADLMMMAGAFIGWQPVMVAFFVAGLPGIVFAVIQLIVFRDRSLPFGPSLALAVMITLLAWSWLGPRLQILFFYGPLILILAGAVCVIILISSYAIRLFQMTKGSDGGENEPK